MNNKKEKSRIDLYNTFYSSKSFEKKNNNNYNSILKGTKSILKNCLSFKQYIKNYKKSTEIISFKSPNIKKYPILNKKSLSLIPFSRTSMYKEEEEKNNNKINVFKTFEPILSSDEINDNNKLNLRKKLKINLKILKYKYQKHINKKKEKENPIISEFFYKWTRNDSDDIKNPKLDEFSSLCYDEKKIFFSDYNDLLKEKIQYMKNNKITNLQENIESEFFDMKGKKIKMELISMKFIFKEINENNVQIGNEQIINLPLSFVFLYYINGFDFFKKIILSSIKFSNNFNVVNFNDKNIYLLIKKYFRNLPNFENLLLNENKKNSGKFSFLKKDTCNYGSNLKLKRSFTISKNVDTRKKTIKMPSIPKKKDEENKIKTIKIVHVNKENQKKEKRKEILRGIKDIKQFKNINEKVYDEIEFFWETPFKTFKVTIQLPIMKLWCEHLNKTVIAFCDKNLFLFMFKNNFINWDFHALHYFFSIKYFRKLILKKFSFKFKPLIRSLLKNQNNNNVRNFEEYFYNNNINKTEERKYDLPFLETTVYIREKKVNNLLNENNESFTFFYTDNFNTNSIIDFYGYRRFIEYNELNPKKSWQFYLNFKQMLYLIKINRYEALEAFLPKIIKTNFEFGTLELDFSAFNYFNSKILNYKKNDVYNEYKNLGDKLNDNKKKENLKIDIKIPYIIIEKFVEGINFSNISGEIEISQKYLNKFCKVKNTNIWTKIILSIIEQKNKENNMKEKKY